MLTNRSIPEAVVIPELAYPDVAAAAAWLCAVFGFQERLRIGAHRIQLTVGPTGAIVVVELTGAADRSADRAHALLVRIADVDQHHARAQAFGATILRLPETHPYGERQYTVTDLGATTGPSPETIADIDPATWGGTLAPRPAQS